MAEAKKPLNADLDLPPEIQAKLANYEAMEARAARADAIADERDRLKKQMLASVDANTDVVTTDENGARQFKHQIDLPPVGGYGLRINGMDYFHGQVYSFSEDQMRGVLEMEYRCWAHERSIRGSNENVYRRQTQYTLGGGAMVNSRRSLMG